MIQNASGTTGWNTTRSEVSQSRPVVTPSRWITAAALCVTCCSPSRRSNGALGCVLGGAAMRSAPLANGAVLERVLVLGDVDDPVDEDAGEVDVVGIDAAV